MSCLLKMYEMRDSLTGTEIILADFIQKNKDKVINYSAQKLSEETKTSTAAVVRFSKKIGYNGFPDLKLDLVKDLQNEPKELDTVLDAKDDIKTLLEKAEQSNLLTIENTYKLLDIKVIEKVINQLIHCKSLYLLGIGSSGIVCQDFQHKLLRIGKHVEFMRDTHLQLTVIPNVTKEDLVIFISYSGKTKELKTAAKWLRKQGVPTVAITNSKYNDLAKLCDYVLTIPSEEKELRIGAMSSRLSSLLIIDILYYGLVRNDMEDTSHRIIATREIINEFEK